MKRFYCLRTDAEGMQEEFFDTIHEAWDAARDCEAYLECQYWWGETQGAEGEHKPLCYRCGEETKGDLVELGPPDNLEDIRIYCTECSEKIRHADEHGSKADQFEARFVE